MKDNFYLILKYGYIIGASLVATYLILFIIINKSKKKTSNVDRTQTIVPVDIRTIKYEKKYKEIIVTYFDNESKTFTPNDWAIYENGIRKIAKAIKFVKK